MHQSKTNSVKSNTFYLIQNLLISVQNNIEK